MRRNNSDIVPLDPRTAIWLARLARITRKSAAEIVASMLRDIRVDDERLHAATAANQLVDETCH